MNMMFKIQTFNIQNRHNEIKTSKATVIFYKFCQKVYVKFYLTTYFFILSTLFQMVNKPNYIETSKLQ